MTKFQHLMNGANLVALITLSAPALSQTVGNPNRVDDFTPENAIVDTSIPFAIGASEAQQSLRGAFGWPTFQEGLVEGVYFRFDPDGYARFSPNPRLDVDVFEVLCKSRTNECLARKGDLTILLSQQGQLQLQISDAMSTDSFFLSEGVGEIQVPERVLQPLDLQMENLLASSTELIVRRGTEEVSRHSLRGFLATTSYLRWIFSQQDYSVLPRGWPVPNPRSPGGQSQGTQTVDWQSPMPQPQFVAIATPVPDVAADSDIDQRLAELQEMIKALRDPESTEAVVPEAAGAALPAKAEETQQLELIAAQLTEELELLRNATQTTMAMPVQEGTVLSYDANMEYLDQGVTDMKAKPVGEEERTTSDKLAFLIEELGLDLRTAVAVLELAPARPGVPASNADMTSPATLRQEGSYTDALEMNLASAAPDEDFLLQLLSQAPVPDAQPETVDATVPIATVDEYLLLADYFHSAVLPALNNAPPN